MSHQRLFQLIWSAATLLTGLSSSFSCGAADQPLKAETSETKPAVQTIEVRGRVVCLAEEMHRLYQSDLPTNHEHLYGFRTEDGRYFTLLRTKFSEALFTDKRLHEKDLLLKGRTFSGSQVFEPITIRSIRDGVVNDLFYYCVICDIYTVTPGICDCCREPIDLVERPLPQKSKASK